ncbi:MAG: HD domain-containing protein [Kiritimatiellia bacterium]|jgi:exopolyphosphatase/guanosine-5'-triphosphate,3'-diphosphate pyrophosphatase
MKKSSSTTEGQTSATMIAVIDIGATFIRMLIAEKRGANETYILEKAVQSVPIGRDIVTSNMILKTTVEQCVQILKSFHKLLGEYGIPPESVIAVATATLRLADNSAVFLDRLANISRIAFRLLDQGQICYYYHLAFRSLYSGGGSHEKGEVVVLEVGGLTCSMLCRKDGEIRFVQTYSVGSLQMRQQMEKGDFRPRQLIALANGRTNKISEQLCKNVDDVKAVKLFLMGREMRFAGARLRPDRNRSTELDPATGMITVPVDELEGLLKQIETASTEEIVRNWRVSYSDAELIAPALSIAISVARAVPLKSVCISSLSFCHGVLEEAVDGTLWTDTMRKHVLRIARATGRKYQHDDAHAEQVAKLSLQLFDLLQEEHGCTQRHRLFLEVAALLHDIGAFVSAHSHNIHSMYLIRNTEFAGLSSEEIELIAVIARYHRKTIPKTRHPEYTALSHADRLVVSKLAAILRVADTLARVYDRSLGKIRLELNETSLICIPARRVAISAEQVALAEKGDLFELMYGRHCQIYDPE